MNGFPDFCREASALETPQKAFTICTLMTNPDQYKAMMDTFVKGGFTPDRADYRYIDNASHNQFDAYSGLNRMLENCQSQYIILCHQDVTLIEDGYEALVSRLAELEKVDPKWALAGNAGATGTAEYAMHITNRDDSITKIGVLPASVESLDENFMVLKRSANLGFSADLKGFHMYGADIVLQAKFRGYTSYAIDFHLKHHSNGKMDKSFYDCKMAFEDKYHGLLQSRVIQTTCCKLFLTHSRIIMVYRRIKTNRKRNRAP